MSVKIRLKRTGATNDPSFRVVAADSRSPRDGKFIEILGWYDPKIAGKNVKLDRERIAHWIDHGAQVSDTVKSLMKQAAETEAAEAAAEAAKPKAAGDFAAETVAVDPAPAEAERLDKTPAA